MKVFPSTLPPVQREGFNAGPALKRKNPRMDDGHMLNRRVYGKTPFGMKLAWLLDDEQLRLFEAWFEYQVFRTGEAFTVPIIGFPTVCRLTSGEIAVVRRGNMWNVSITVETLVNAPAAQPNTIPVWPITLPTLERDDYSYTSRSGIITSELEGVPQMRKRFHDDVTPFSGSVILSLQQFGEFRNFYDNTTYGGNSTFLFPFENGQGRTLVRTRFAGQPRIDSLSSWFRAQLSLETSDKPIYNLTEFIEHSVVINDYVAAGYVLPGYVGYYE